MWLKNVALCNNLVRRNNPFFSFHLKRDVFLFIKFKFILYRWAGVVVVFKSNIFISLSIFCFILLLCGDERQSKNVKKNFFFVSKSCAIMRFGKLEETQTQKKHTNLWEKVHIPNNITFFKLHIITNKNKQRKNEMKKTRML
jgi:D-alanyl-lipoteichoic acid acyltransferase DltB (MBOAT superfamily)